VQRTWTVFHQNEDFVYSSRGFIPCRVNKVDNIRMTFQYTLSAIRDAMQPPESDWQHTIMSTSFLTSVSIDSFGTAMRFKTWCVVPYTAAGVLTR